MNKNTYNNGPEGMPRVIRMTESTLDTLIQHSFFDIYLSDGNLARLHALMHDVAEEVLARVPSWQAAWAASVAPQAPAAKQYRAQITEVVRATSLPPRERGELALAIAGLIDAVIAARAQLTNTTGN